MSAAMISNKRSISLGNSTSNSFELLCPFRVHARVTWQSELTCADVEPVIDMILRRVLDSDRVLIIETRRRHPKELNSTVALQDARNFEAKYVGKSFAADIMNLQVTFESCVDTFDDFPRLDKLNTRIAQDPEADCLLFEIPLLWVFPSGVDHKCSDVVELPNGYWHSWFGLFGAVKRIAVSCQSSPRHASPEKCQLFVQFEQLTDLVKCACLCWERVLVNGASDDPNALAWLNFEVGYADRESLHGDKAVVNREEEVNSTKRISVLRDLENASTAMGIPQWGAKVVGLFRDWIQSGVLDSKRTRAAMLAQEPVPHRAKSRPQDELHAECWSRALDNVLRFVSSADVEPTFGACVSLLNSFKDDTTVRFNESLLNSDETAKFRECILSMACTKEAQDKIMRQNADQIAHMSGEELLREIALDTKRTRKHKANDDNVKGVRRAPSPSRSAKGASLSSPRYQSRMDFSGEEGEASESEDTTTGTASLDDDTLCDIARNLVSSVIHPFVDNLPGDDAEFVFDDESLEAPLCQMDSIAPTVDAEPTSDSVQLVNEDASYSEEAAVSIAQTTTPLVIPHLKRPTGEAARTRRTGSLAEEKQLDASTSTPQNPRRRNSKSSSSEMATPGSGRKWAKKAQQGEPATACFEFSPSNRAQGNALNTDAEPSASKKRRQQQVAEPVSHGSARKGRRNSQPQYEATSSSPVKRRTKQNADLGNTDDLQKAYHAFSAGKSPTKVRGANVNSTANAAASPKKARGNQLPGCPVDPLLVLPMSPEKERSEPAGRAGTERTPKRSAGSEIPPPLGCRRVSPSACQGTLPSSLFSEYVGRYSCWADAVPSSDFSETEGTESPKSRNKAVDCFMERALGSTPSHTSVTKSSRSLSSTTSVTQSTYWDKVSEPLEEPGWQKEEHNMSRPQTLSYREALRRKGEMRLLNMSAPSPTSTSPEEIRNTAHADNLVPHGSVQQGSVPHGSMHFSLTPSTLPAHRYEHKYDHSLKMYRRSTEQANIYPDVLNAYHTFNNFSNEQMAAALIAASHSQVYED